MCVQAWLPNASDDGGIVLNTQSLPFCVVGSADLMALFRCISCKYSFSTDMSKPWLMGPVGRVYVTAEPEISRNVQQYDPSVYLRVNEAARCQVSACMFLPVFNNPKRDRVVAVLEIVQTEDSPVFCGLAKWARTCLEGVDLYTVEELPEGETEGFRLGQPALTASALESKVEAAVPPLARTSPTDDRNKMFNKEYLGTHEHRQELPPLSTGTLQTQAPQDSTELNNSRLNCSAKDQLFNSSHTHLDLNKISNKRKEIHNSSDIENMRSRTDLERKEGSNLRNLSDCEFSFPKKSCPNGHVPKERPAPELYAENGHQHEDFTGRGRGSDRITVKGNIEEHMQSIIAMDRCNVLNYLGNYAHVQEEPYHDENVEGRNTSYMTKSLASIDILAAEDIENSVGNSGSGDGTNKDNVSGEEDSTGAMCRS